MHDGGGDLDDLEDVRVGSTANVSGTTYADGTTYHHEFNLDYTCRIADGKTVIIFTSTGSATGSGAITTDTITPDGNGGGVYAFTGANGGYDHTYGGTYDASGRWTTGSAAAGVNEVYDVGTNGTRDAFRGSVVGSFTGIPTNCPAPEVPAPVTGTHGEYVSGATHAGIKGKDLAAIAKDVTLVGPYKPRR